MPSTYTIIITASGDPVPDPFPSPPLKLHPGDKIQWVNYLAVPIDSFTLPSCVSPKTSPAPISPGATTRLYTVNHGSGSHLYSYSYTLHMLVVRNGTINVS